MRDRSSLPCHRRQRLADRDIPLIRHSKPLQACVGRRVPPNWGSWESLFPPQGPRYFLGGGSLRKRQNSKLVPHFLGFHYGVQYPEREHTLHGQRRMRNGARLQSLGFGVVEDLGAKR